MPAIPIIGAVAAVVGAGAAVAGTVVGAIQGKKQNDIAQQQQAIAQQQLVIQTQNSYLNGLNTVRDYEKTIADLEGAKIQYGIDIRDAHSQIESYDKWLGNYNAQYAQEVQSKQAQTDQLTASGKETYENFLNAIGYADAMAGATGRVGAGTSQAYTTGMLDQKLVDYVGADRTLDANGGLFGSQLTAANMEMDQLKLDLEFQRQEMTANRQNMQDTIGDWQQAIALTDQSITNSRAAKNDLQQFIDQNFGKYNQNGTANLPIKIGSLEGISVEGAIPAPMF
jgi:chromosome segregation ATPase